MKKVHAIAMPKKETGRWPGPTINNCADLPGDLQQQRRKKVELITRSGCKYNRNTIDR
jgi:hypothetical protein